VTGPPMPWWLLAGYLAGLWALTAAAALILRRHDRRRAAARAERAADDARLHDNGRDLHTTHTRTEATR
jgi:hypothetical protein